MKPLTDKQKKAAWIVAGILLVLHFLPNLTAPLFSAFGHRNQPAVVQPRVTQPSLPRPIPNAAQPIDPLAAQYVGLFQGQQLMPDLSNCKMSLEVRPTISKPGFFTGSEQMSCMPSSLFFRGPGMAARKGDLGNIVVNASPVSASMSGSMVEGTMTFRIEEVLGATPSHCAPTSYNMKNFGTNRVMVEWQANPCPGGHMVLNRSRA